MDFVVRAAGKPSRLGVLPGTFHPPTCAHMALARSGLAVTDEVLLVLPRELPHKSYEEVGFAGRMRMLAAAVAGQPRLSVGASDGGLFLEIARECRRGYGEPLEVAFICGRDAAERIVNWDYGSPGAARRMLREFELLVASRGGGYEPPPDLRGRIHTLALEDAYDGLSATEVRRRIAAGESWEHLVPEAIVPLVRELY